MIFQIYINYLTPIKTNEDNNYLFSKYVKDTKVFLEVDFGRTLDSLNEITEEYLDSYVQLVDSANEADIIVTIGDSALLNY